MSEPAKTTSDVIKEVVQGKILDPKLSEIATAFIRYCGGTKGFAQKIFEDFEAAPKGGVVRQRTIAMILQVMPKEKGLETDEIANLTDEDLQREMDAQLRQMPQLWTEPNGQQSQ